MDGGLSSRGFGFPASRSSGPPVGKACLLGAFLLGLAGGPAAAQHASGSARSGTSTNPFEAFFSTIFGGAPARPSPSRLDSPGPETPSRSAPRREGGKTSGGGSYLVCVRTCDGAFFPLSTSGTSRPSVDACRLLCPNAETALYAMPMGGTIDQAVSLAGQRYADLPNALKFEQALASDCSCRRPGQSWADALAAAEARYRHGAHDILVTKETSDRMSRPVVDLKMQPATASLAAAPAPAAAPAKKDPGLDVNGVDTGLAAATAAISREGSGIRDMDADAGARFGLRQGRTIDGVAPDGSARKVRILPAPY